MGMGYYKIMKLFFFNDKLNDISCNGSFSVASRNLNEASQKLNYYAHAEKADHVIYMDAFNFGAKINDKSLIPYVVSEYNRCGKFLVEHLNLHKIILAISQQAKDSFVNSGVDSDKIHVAHLGTNPQNWPNYKMRDKIPIFTFLTVNTSNNRSGYEIMIPAFLEWAQGKDVRLIVKDQFNAKLFQIIQTIDKQSKIVYISDNLNHSQLVSLYNQAHVHVYANSVTSFGLNILDSACAGLPQIVSNSSAIPEFTSSKHVQYVDCYEQKVDNILLAQYQAFGLVNNLLPLENYEGILLTSRPKFDSIIKELDFAYNNYNKMVEKNDKFVEFIKNNLKWNDSVEKIVEILK